MHKAYGIHAVTALLHNRPKQIKHVWICQQLNPRLRTLLNLAEQVNVTVSQVPRTSLEQLLPDVVHQGVVAELTAHRYSEVDLFPLLESLTTPPCLLILDGVQDPHNLGACLRSADAAGVHMVLAPKDRAVGLTPAVLKVACGAIVPFIQITNLGRVIRALKERGIWVYGAVGEAEHSVFATDLTGPCALVLGAEEKGLRRLTREHCDVLIKIPMLGAVESLNVSVAAGICLFEVVRQRSP